MLGRVKKMKISFLVFIFLVSFSLFAKTQTNQHVQGQKVEGYDLEDDKAPLGYDPYVPGAKSYFYEKVLRRLFQEELFL